MIDIIGDRADAVRAVRATLERHVPANAMRRLEAAGVTVRILNKNEKYLDASGELSRLQVNVDEWPAPPAGLFVVADRCLYLRSVSPMTVIHELGHAFDLALGGGVYLSSIDPEVREAFKAARAFVTPYAATGLDEYFAECFRAYLEVNDVASFWPRATRARLRKLDPTMHAILERLIEGPEQP